MKSRVGLAAIVGCLLAGAVLAAAAGGADLRISCEIVSAGPAGPRGDVLKIVDHTITVTSIDDEDGEIVVYNNLYRNPIVCSGGTPTVTDIDAIEFRTERGAPFIGYHGDGPLGPGATPEPGSGSEIEISVVEEDEEPVLNVGGSQGDDSIEVGMLGKDEIGVDLNPRADGAAGDADVTMKVRPGSDSYIRINGRDGDDELSALGGPAFTAPVEVERLNLIGGPGDDHLAGGPGRDSLNGELGNDVMLGGRGRDNLVIGPGRDVAEGGKGADRIENRSSVGGIPDDLAPDKVLGGAGDDYIDVISEHGGDRVDCGSGDQDEVVLEPGDRQRRCEVVRTER